MRSTSLPRALLWASCLLPSLAQTTSTLPAITATLTTTTTTPPPSTSRRLSPYLAPSHDDAEIDEFLMFGSRGPLLKKRDHCKSGYEGCDAIGHGDMCCPDDTACTHDENGNPACCPHDAVCTGALSTVTVSASTVPSAPYPFYYIPTSYPNPGACTSAASYCNAQYTFCTSYLEGRASSLPGAGYINPVTIGNVNGGKGYTFPGTVPAQTTLPTASATGVCLSLSSEACHKLREEHCTVFGKRGTEVEGEGEGKRRKHHRVANETGEAGRGRGKAGVVAVAALLGAGMA